MFTWLKKLFTKEIPTQVATAGELTIVGLEHHGITGAEVEAAHDTKSFRYSFIRVKWALIFVIIKVDTVLYLSDYTFRAKVIAQIASALILREKKGKL